MQYQTWDDESDVANDNHDKPGDPVDGLAFDELSEARNEERSDCRDKPAGGLALPRHLNDNIIVIDKVGLDDRCLRLIDRLHGGLRRWYRWLIRGDENGSRFLNHYRGVYRWHIG